MKEVREAGGPWTVAGDPQEGGKMGLLLVKCGVGGGGGTNTNVQMEGQQRRKGGDRLKTWWRELKKVSAVCWTGQLPVKKEGVGGAVAGSQSCPYEVTAC